MRSFERWPWRPLIRRLRLHERLGSASSILGQWLASTTTTSDSRMRSRTTWGAWPRSVTQASVLLGENMSPSIPVVKQYPTGSCASCGIEKLWISRSRNLNEDPVSKICHWGLHVRSFWTAFAVDELAKNFRFGNFFRLSIPDMWSLCSWVTNTASTCSIDSPAADMRLPSLRAENPASRSIRVPSVTTSALLPELPLPRMQNLIAIWEHHQ